MPMAQILRLSGMQLFIPPCVSTSTRLRSSRNSKTNMSVTKSYPKFTLSTSVCLHRTLLRRGRSTSIETAQLDEEYTAAQQPLYSTLPEADDVSSVDGCANIRMAVRPNQRIIMLNRGIGGKGFMVCCDCGAAMPMLFR